MENYKPGYHGHPPTNKQKYTWYEAPKCGVKRRKKPGVILKNRWDIEHKLRAAILMEVYQDTGVINYTEAYLRRHGRNRNYNSACVQAKRQFGKPEVLMEFEKLLKVTDKDLAKNLTPEVIIQDLMRDIELLNTAVREESIDIETMVKVLAAKAPKQKLLGQAIGMWKQEAKNPEDEKTADQLLTQLQRFGGIN